jgi:lysozyme
VIKLCPAYYYPKYPSNIPPFFCAGQSRAYFKMNIRQLFESVKSHEGFRSDVYKDTLGFDTIGYGFAIKDLKMDEDIAGIILERKLLSLIIKVYNKFPWVSISPDEVQEVVIEMCYQLGVSGFSRFRKTIGYMESADYEKAAAEMLDSRWAKQTPNRALELSNKVKQS